MSGYIFGLIIALLALWYFGVIGSDDSRELGFRGQLKYWINWIKNPSEAYRSCRGCDGYSMPRNGMAVINPYLWPYSATLCVDDLYILNKDSGLDLNFTPGPPVHLNTPDHVELVN